MKKLLVLSTAALLCGAALSAKTADELRIYINPGHGAWTPNDRPCTTVKLVDGEVVELDPKTAAAEVAYPDTTAFYESNTNLQKGLEVFRQLQAMGLQFDATLNQTNDKANRIGAALDLSNNIVMSHVKCGPYPATGYLNESGKWVFSEDYSRNLTEVAREVETNNFDMFISIHSNAATDGSAANYPLYLYRGPDNLSDATEADKPLMETSIAMAKASWPHAIANTNAVWSSYLNSMNIRGDWSFYGSHSVSSATGAEGYLGVLKHHIPGFLVEGYFHTYQPARHRALNWDVCHMEGYAYAMGIADYFNLTKPSTGNIYGTVRDLHEKFSHKWYSPAAKSADIYMAINGATVTLSKNGEQIATYTTDNHFNGAYVFKNLEPGTYTVSVSHPDYKEMAEPISVTVKAASITYPDVISLESTAWVPAQIAYYDYPDDLEGEGAIAPAAEYTFDMPYSDEAIEALDQMNVRRTLARDKYLYVLAVNSENKGVISIYDTEAKQLVRTLDTTGAEGDIRDIADIALTSDGYLIAANNTIQGYNGTNKMFFYRWEKNAQDGLADGDMIKFASFGHSGNWSNSETTKSIAYAGKWEDGTILMLNKSNTAVNARLEIISNVEGSLSGIHNNLNTAEGYSNVTAMGDAQIVISPLHKDAVIITSEGVPPTEWQLSSASAGVPTKLGAVPADLLQGSGFRSSFFKFNGAVFMAAPTANGVELLNVTNGLDNAKVVNLIGCEIPESDEPAQKRAWSEAGAGVPSANAYVHTERDDATGKLTKWDINMLLTRGNVAVTKMTTATAEQPVQRANYAYDLDMTSNDNLYEVTFKSTGAAPKGTLTLTNVADDTDVKTYDLGEIALGENSFTVNSDDLTPNSDYNWAIAIESNPVPTPGKFFGVGMTAKNAARGGIVVITDPEQKAFGKIITAKGYALGIDVFSPVNELLGTYHAGAPTMNAGNGSSLMRGGERNGKAIFVDWSDAGAGYWQFDPEAPETLPNILEGTKNSGGNYKLDGVSIGGGATSLSFYGKGEDEFCLAWVEDYPATDGNNLVLYNIAGAPTFNKAPDFMFDGSVSGDNFHKLFANTNVEVIALENGFWCGQVRSSGQNTAGCPAFVYADYQGNILLNSAQEDLIDVVDAGGAGMAINSDLSVFAVSDNNYGINVFDVTWDNNVPTLKFKYNFPVSKGGSSGEAVQMKFDPAGNLAVFNRGRGYELYTLTNPAPTATTPARSELLIKGASTGVEDVMINNAIDANAPVEYFNLQGQRVNNPAAGSIVIRRQGNKTDKIIVR